MALIQFTRNHTDHSTDKGYQFEFFCDRCGNGFMTAFQPSAIGMATSAVRVVGNLFGGFLGSVGSNSYEIERAIQGPGHDNAFRHAVEETKPNFKQCPRCSHWVCASTCWNKQKQLCYACAPDLQTELASAQVQATIDQMHDQLRAAPLTKDMDLLSDASAACPACGAHTQGAKFCPECGVSLRPKNECNRCGTKVDGPSKFCPECGNKMA